MIAELLHSTVMRPVMSSLLANAALPQCRASAPLLLRVMLQRGGGEGLRKVEKEGVGGWGGEGEEENVTSQCRECRRRTSRCRRRL